MFGPGTYRIAADLVRVRDANDDVIATRSWGDRLTVTGGDADGIDVVVSGKPGRVKKPPQSALVPVEIASAPRILRLDFVDVQQGDATVLETPSGKTLIVDGGENVQFSRYLASRFPQTTEGKPKRIDCILVTHGDASATGRADAGRLRLIDRHLRARAAMPGPGSARRGCGRSESVFQAAGQRGAVPGALGRVARARRPAAVPAA